MSITGGEWRVAGTTQSRYIDARQSNGMVQEVAWCGQCEYGDNIDNARLLCASPKLLDALEIARDRLLDCLPTLDRCNGFDPLVVEGVVKAISIADSAIAIARGEK